MKTNNWQRNLPTLLTFSRIAVAPIFMWLIHMNNPTWGRIAALIFILASFTDFLDGYYARKFDVESSLGKLMDPIADKILVAVVLIMLIPSGRVDPFMVILLLGRDLLIGGIRAVAAANQLIIAAKPFGKWKAALQMIAVPMILLGPVDLTSVLDIASVIDLASYGYWLLWVSVILSLISGTQYILAFCAVNRSHPKSS